MYAFSLYNLLFIFFSLILDPIEEVDLGWVLVLGLHTYEADRL